MKKNILIVAGLILLVVIGFSFMSSNYKEQAKEETAANIESSLIRDYHPKIGPDNSKVTIVEFLDPECEACAATYPIVKQLLSEYAGKVQLIIRYMPFHSNSAVAVSYIESAREQGKYFEALEVLFKNLHEWGSHANPQPELIPTYLEGLGMDMNQLKTTATSFKFTQKLEQDKTDGMALGVRQTPTFFVNGKMLDSIDYESIKTAIEQELAK